MKNRLRTNQQDSYEGIDLGINPLINNTYANNEEDSTKFKVHADVENSDERLQPLIIFEEHLNVVSCDQNDLVGNNDTYEFVCDLPVQIINEEPLIDTIHTPETVRNCHPTVINSIVPSDNKNFHLLKQNDSNNVQLTIENCPINYNQQPGISISRCVNFDAINKNEKFLDLKDNQQNNCEAIDKQNSSKKEISPKAVKKGNIKSFLTNYL